MLSDGATKDRTLLQWRAFSWRIKGKSNRLSGLLLEEINLLKVITVSKGVAQLSPPNLVADHHLLWELWSSWPTTQAIHGPNASEVFEDVVSLFEPDEHSSGEEM